MIRKSRGFSDRQTRSIHLFLRYWIVLSLALLIELLLDQTPILKKSKPLYVAYQAVKLAFVLWCLAPVALNGAEVNPYITLLGQSHNNHCKRVILPFCK